MRFLDGEADLDDFDRDNLATVSRHYAETALSGRLPGLHLFHYADMVVDARATVARLAFVAKIEAEDSFIERVAAATSFGAMRSRAEDYVPVAGTGFWKSDAAFFDSASSRKWEGQLSEAELALYEKRLEEHIADELARDWLENGDTTTKPRGQMVVDSSMQQVRRLAGVLRENQGIGQPGE